MHRHARPRALLILLLALLAGAVSAVSPAPVCTNSAVLAMSPANVAPHPDDDEVTRAPATAIRHLTAPTMSGLPAEATRLPVMGPASSGAPPQHHGSATQQNGLRQGRAPPAISDR